MMEKVDQGPSRFKTRAALKFLVSCHYADHPGAWFLAAWGEDVDFFPDSQRACHGTSCLDQEDAALLQATSQAVKPHGPSKGKKVGHTKATYYPAAHPGKKLGHTKGKKGKKAPASDPSEPAAYPGKKLGHVKGKKAPPSDPSEPAAYPGKKHGHTKDKKDKKAGKKLGHTKGKKAGYYPEPAAEVETHLDSSGQSCAPFFFQLQKNPKCTVS